MNELRQKRQKLGLTQIQMARACGMSRRSYQMYEEKACFNETYQKILNKMDEMGRLDSDCYISNSKYIKKICRDVFSHDYPEVQCAYLFGSYARGEATGESDIDLLVICPPMGLKFYEMATELEERLHKPVDLHSHRQLDGNEALLVEILKEGLKIYG